MGRTQRKRKLTKSRNFLTCDAEKELILLNSWLSKQGIRRNEKLYLARFDDTGRGVLTKKKIKSGEELINLPLNSTINVITILTDIIFCDLFLPNQKECFRKYQKCISFQSLMAFYLTFLKVQGENSKWSIYLDSLPKQYTVPYFLPSGIQSEVDSDIFAAINKQKDIINTSYSIFESLLKSSISKSELVLKFKEKFELTLFEWAYFTVNTRCVYMDLTNLVNLRNIENTLLTLISDNTKISLCPYLDMINHSSNAKNETKLVVRNNIENVNISTLEQDLFSDVWFSIYTKNNFEAFTQVFICYGDSHNLKLITEYGFFLPDNELDYVSFAYESIIDFFKNKSMKLSQDQINFINNHGLNKDLYIDFKGLSFNLYGFLMVVKYYYNQTSDVSRLIYSAALCSNNNDLNDLIKPMATRKLENIKVSISKLKNYDNKCNILSNCVGLLCQYCKILEKFIKC